ncbi:hypothetical protein LRR18_13160 [Mangrovimonas sp. AS39]|uniref:hypothetical protein n=1 Tax=Mangrovimonas TaxID=1211036 RepID=UPI000AAC1D94|nr:MULTISPECIES: hypothetical protein [Mangrovimonas]MCF1192538.1 hypothetical protein [Mangrovimonas futianensis]MCF1196132.1 hypothetical protein [Mangrovimonas futianensis]MCF1422517.1 hypothetical protein [Mangrovimonas futianensis]NIK93137.1 hypothetical protein [Mangrovimonas sp. CR14]
MKKVISLFGFMLLFFVGMQTTVAQDKKVAASEDLIAQAKQDAIELSKKLHLNGQQEELVLEVFVEAAKNTGEIKKANLEPKLEKARMDVINENLDLKMTDILTPEQYKKYHYMDMPK